jgi:hypothetical protein
MAQIPILARLCPIALVQDGLAVPLMESPATRVENPHHEISALPEDGGYLFHWVVFVSLV